MGPRPGGLRGLIFSGSVSDGNEVNLRLISKRHG